MRVTRGSLPPPLLLESRASWGVVEKFFGWERLPELGGIDGRAMEILRKD